MEVDLEVRDSVTTVKYKENGAQKSKIVATSAVENLFKQVTTEAVASTEVFPHSLVFRARSNKGNIMLGFEIPEHIGPARFNRSCYENSRLYQNAIDRDEAKYKESDYFADPDTTRNDCSGSRAGSSYRGEIFDVVWPSGLTMVELIPVGDGKTYKTGTFYQAGMTTPFHGLNTMLYEWPGSNVYSPGMKICIGVNSISNITDLGSVGYLPWMFYNGVSNNDLTTSKFRRTREMSDNHIETPYDLYRYMRVAKDKPPKPFPYDIMKQIHTVKDFLGTNGFAQ